MLKLIPLIALASLLASGCTTAAQRRNCEVTCLEKNEVSQQVVRNGCVCKMKEDPEKRVYEGIDIGD